MMIPTEHVFEKRDKNVQASLEAKKLYDDLRSLYSDAQRLSEFIRGMPQQESVSLHGIEGPKKAKRLLKKIHHSISNARLRSPSAQRSSRRRSNF
jgi:hypothetical protein